MAHSTHPARTARSVARVLVGDFASRQAEKCDTSSRPARVLAMMRGQQQTIGDEFFQELLVTVDETDEIRAKVVDAARAAMLDFGLRRMTIEDVAKRAGIGRPTLYRRFADKDALVRAVWLRESRQLIADVWDAVKGEPTPEKRVVCALVVATRKLAENDLLQRLLATEPETVISFMMRDGGALVDACRSLLAPQSRVLQQAGHLTTIDIEDLLEVLARLFISIALIPTSRVSATDDDALERFANEALLPVLMLMRKKKR